MELVASDEAAGLDTPVWDEDRAMGSKDEGKEVRLRQYGDWMYSLAGAELETAC